MDSSARPFLLCQILLQHKTAHDAKDKFAGFKHVISGKALKLKSNFAVLDS
jgi:hypothetical protein